MATSLSQLRKSRSSTLDKIVKDLDSGGARRSDEDNRFWKITRDKAGNGSAVIRFLPPVNGDELPWVKEFSYGFQSKSTGKWYINLSPSTIGLPDPVMEYNAAAWASKDEDRMNDAKTRKRRTQFISNIYVVKDPGNPENEGKVFLFKYGKKIHDLIVSKAKPEFDDDTPVIVWDLDEGANLKLRIKVVSDYPNYDSSEWAAQSPLSEDDDALQSIIDKCYKLSEFLEPSRFKSYDALKQEFDRSLNGTATQSAASKIAKEAAEDDGPQFDLDKEVEKAAPVKKVVKEQPKPSAVADDDEDLESFKKMLADL
jgi:gp32 DNA binding protein like